MINIVYLVIFVVGTNGAMTSQAIPQANMTQCLTNARIFNTGENNKIVINGFSNNAKTQSAMCIVGIK